MDGNVKSSLDASAGPPSYSRGNEGSLVSALKTLLFFTILMVTLPIGLYFASKAYVFEGSMKMSSSDSYFYAAIVAVLAVHVVLALFVYVAWNEGTPKGKANMIKTVLISQKKKHGMDHVDPVCGPSSKPNITVQRAPRSGLCWL
ncbi:hypothetical protein WMY93_009031 [Mugilogobius chulae]|uniref:Vacuolar ATPase assembly integral membrane protein VMA21 n=1 Tax=Mugilogobius chulae TaxID=88201 RepID=A0AAW0PAD4_9GOBI